MEKTAILTPCNDLELKKDYRKYLIVTSPFLRNDCAVTFMHTNNGLDSLGSIMKRINDGYYGNSSVVYLQEDNSVKPHEAVFTYREESQNKAVKKSGIVSVNSISNITDAMMRSISKEGNLLIIPHHYLNNKNFHDRVSFACNIYFFRTYIIVPKGTGKKEKRNIYNGLFKSKYHLKPQFDITPTSEDIKREFKIRCKEIHSELFGISLAGIGCIVTVAFGVAGLVIEGLIFTTDATITGIRYGILKAKENSCAKRTSGTFGSANVL